MQSVARRAATGAIVTVVSGFAIFVAAPHYGTALKRPGFHVGSITWRPRLPRRSPNSVLEQLQPPPRPHL